MPVAIPLVYVHAPTYPSHMFTCIMCVYVSCVHVLLVVVCLQLEKLQEFAMSLRATEDHNFQYAGTNIEKIIKEKVH